MSRSDMTVELGVYTRQRGQLKSPAMIVFAFATVFFPRILESAGFPPIINFLHFAVVPLVFGITFFRFQSKNKQAAYITQVLLVVLFIFLGVMLVSAFLNAAGLINVIIGYLLLTEPFLLLIAIIYTPMAAAQIQWLKRWILGFAASNVVLALVQHLLIQTGIMRVTSMTLADNVQGVFYQSGAGHVVSSSVSLTFGLYYFSGANNAPFWFRAVALGAVIMQMLFADAKQVLLVFFGAWLLLIVMKLTDLRVVFQYVIGAVFASYGFLWALNNLPLFAAFRGWIRPEIYGPDGDATLLKFAAIPIIVSHHTSPFNWLFGLGPGHTVGRLGGWMIKDYGALLEPLGVTSSPVTQLVWQVWGDSYLNSSFFSPLFGWIGIWGDYGFLGLATYLLLWWLVWHFLCQDDFSSFCVITVFVFGLIFTQLEEPGYMLTVTTVIGLRWQELRLKNEAKLGLQP